MTYFDGTVEYLNDPAHADVNVVMWSWCSIEGHDVQIYLDNFEEHLQTLGYPHWDESANPACRLFLGGASSS